MRRIMVTIVSIVLLLVSSLPTGNVVASAESSPKIFEFITRETATKALKDSIDDNLAITRNGEVYTARSVWIRANNPANWAEIGPQGVIPTRLVVPSDAQTSVFPMGIVWKDGDLFITPPVQFGRGEGAVALSSNKLTKVEHIIDALSPSGWNKIKIWDVSVVSTYWDEASKTIFWWRFLPQLSWDGDLIIDVIDVSVRRLTLADDLDLSKGAPNVGNTPKFMVGQQVRVVSTKWVYDKMSLAEGDGDTWEVYRRFWKSTMLERADGSLLLVTYYDGVMFTRPCADNKCVNTSGSAVSEEMVGEEYQVVSGGTWPSLYRIDMKDMISKLSK